MAIGPPYSRSVHDPFMITAIYYWVKIFDWNACTNKMETRFLETKISFWNFKFDCYSICGQNLDKHGKNGIFHDKFMNTKWTLNELKMNWTRPKIWATITHVRELKISQNMSQIHELNWTELNGNDRRSRSFFPISAVSLILVANLIWHDLLNKCYL